MHRYSDDTNDKVKLITITLLLFLVTVGSLFLLNTLVSSISIWLSVIITIASLVLTYSLVYLFVTNYLLKAPWFKQLLRIRTPDLSGIWIGTFTRTQTLNETTDPTNQTVYMVMHIQHDTDGFLLDGNSQLYHSTSYIADIKVNTTSNDCILTIGYYNSSHMHIKNQSHRAEVHNRISGDYLHGEYFAGKSRGTAGFVDLARIHEKTDIEKALFYERSFERPFNMNDEDRAWFESKLQNVINKPT